MVEGRRGGRVVECTRINMISAGAPLQLRMSPRFALSTIVLALFLLVLLVSTNWIQAVSATSNGNNPARLPRSPYAVLGVGRTATQDDIKRRYRKLCLSYHPDKQRHLPASEQKEYERLFKELQAAYAEIGTAEARRTYELRERNPFSSSSGTTSSNFGGTAGSTTQPQSFADARHAFEQAFRASAAGGAGRGPGFPTSSATFYGFNVNDLFNNPGSRGFSSPFGFGSASPFWKPSLKSIFVFKVPVPLQDLYSGKPDYSFHVRDNIFHRIRAAFRGGIGYLVLYQSILYSLPLLRLSGKAAALWGLFLFQHFLPRARPPPSHGHDDDLYYDFCANLKSGYKGGTKFIFDDSQTGQPGVEVHVILKEAKHPIYRRVGNQLHVTCAVSRKQAKAGCQVEIPSLHDEDYVLRVDIPAGSRNGDIITFPGKGWPNRKQQGAKGDLVVTVAIATPPWRSRRRNNGKAT